MNSPFQIPQEITNKYKKISEFIQQSGHLGNEEFYFNNYFEDITFPPKQIFVDNLELVFASLDPIAFNIMCQKLNPLSVRPAHYKNRGWQEFFDCINEARAYFFLKTIGAASIEFVDTSNKHGGKTPDLKAVMNGQKLLCEVKTINCSDDERDRRVSREASMVSGGASGGLLNKIRDNINKANKQISTYVSNNRISGKIISFIYIYYEPDHIVGDTIPSAISDFRKEINVTANNDTIITIEYFTPMHKGRDVILNTTDILLP